jgi:copper resistance protein B
MIKGEDDMNRKRQNRKALLLKAGILAAALLPLLLNAVQAHAQTGDTENLLYIQGDRFEYQSNDGNGLYLWDAQGWYGTDFNKFWFKTEGEFLPDQNKTKEAQLQLLYSRAITSFFDLQAGVRHDFKPDPSRSFAVLGVQGLAPYWFEVDVATFLSDDGDVSARMEAEYELLLTQRLIAQPRFETNLALQDVEEAGVGSGINNIELGLRLRYEIKREFAPYVGVSWSKLTGDTKDMAQDEGEDTDTVSFVTGIRFWF